jgi:Fic-DOC domain mobile mystery protein B
LSLKGILCEFADIFPELNQFFVRHATIKEGHNCGNSLKILGISSRILDMATWPPALHKPRWKIRLPLQVWKWAGKYRTNELNIGCDPAEIVQRIPQLLANAKYWLDHKTFPIDECMIRFHQQLVSKIHPFANGNGRHARMITDVIAVKHGQAEFTWGAGANLVAEGRARAAYRNSIERRDCLLGSLAQEA